MEKVEQKMEKVDYIILSEPVYVKCKCPHCEAEIEVEFSDVDFYLDYWGDGGRVACSDCGKDIELGEYKYD